ncbi:MAG: pyridoxal 5'-phosphate synthase glutaminase subunit PdxT [Anaerolineales bacterium]|nr:pyridoxal 5'-phosphate synthase glutaminase subunit PdxT [Anaerolineales bacterium]
MKVGVLALQGDFREHAAMLRQVGAEPLEVRTPAHLAQVAGLIMPGGESTTMAKVAKASGIFEPLRAFCATHPTWGTCAGAILLATEIDGEPPHLALMAMRVLRNAFGRQIDSFTADLTVKGLSGDPLRAVFIRAPIIDSVGAGVEVLSRLDDGRIVAARQGHLLATSFHPELTPDTRMHGYFFDMVRGARLVV